MLAKEEFDAILDNTERVGRWLKWVIVLILGLIVLNLGTAHAASYEFRSGRNHVVLRDAPCKVGGWLANWKTASLTYEGRDYEACWIAQGQVILLLDNSGDLTPVPIEAFKRMTEG